MPTTGSEHNSSHTILPEEIQWNVYCLIATKTLRARTHYVLSVLTSHLINFFAVKSNEVQRTDVTVSLLVTSQNITKTYDMRSLFLIIVCDSFFLFLTRGPSFLNATSSFK